MKCKIPSYISDFVTVDMWRDTENNTFFHNATEGLKFSDGTFKSHSKIISLSHSYLLC